MDPLRQFAGVMIAFAMLAGCLWLLRSKLSPGRVANRRGGARIIACISRLALTREHALYLVKVGPQTILIGVSPHSIQLLRDVPAEISLSTDER